MKTLKKSIALLLFSALYFLATSCSKDDAKSPSYVCSTCSTSPDALAVNDASIKGVYKGIVVGSTGTISINIQNGSNTITATMVLDGVSIALTSNVAVVDGETYVSPFTGNFNGSPISITFQVGLGGVQPTVLTSDIPGHTNAVFELYKETSSSLIEAFEGSVTSSEGSIKTFNIILARSLFKWGFVVSPSNSSEPAETGSGTVNGNQLSTDGKVIGTLNGDVIFGSFQDNSGATITVEGTRTL